MMKKQNSTIKKAKTRDEISEEKLQKMRELIKVFDKKHKSNKFKI
jgi:hypothetical protein|tara:strand:+ start:806 stop:940 length:135 start_codon:yes stop_codon:yes gene_type:complete